MIQFLDDTGTPLAAGFGVTVTASGYPNITGTTDSTGSIAATLASGILYTATFTGSNAPTQTPSFYGNTNGSHLTDDSGNVVTTDSGDAILVDNPSSPTIVTVSGYAGTTNLRVSQFGVEWARAAVLPNARVSQFGIEWAAKRVVPKARVSQFGIEYAKQLLPAALRVTQLGIEMAVKVTYTLKIQPENATVTSTGNVQYKAYLYANGNLVGPVNATWSAEGSAGSIDPSSGLFTAQSSGSGTISAQADTTL